MLCVFSSSLTLFFCQLVVPILFALLRDKDLRVVEMALAKLVTYKPLDKKYLEQLTLLLKNAGPSYKIIAINSLIKLSADPSLMIPMIKSLTKDKNVDIRSAARK